MLKKFLIGTFALAIILGGAIALAPKASAAPQAIVTVADIQYAATVKLGSSGQAALIWQRFLNGYSTTAQLVEDGAFGPLSSVQAKAWQASRGLSADGVLGAMSRASAMAQITSGTPASAFPAGCTSTAGYSSVTGLPCAGVALPAGCTSTAGYSSVTGLSCAGSVSLPAGCSSTAGYSSTTGASCSGGSTPTGALTGGAGSIDLTSTSTGVETEVVAGEAQNVLGLKVEAIDSDVAIKNVKLTFENAGTGSYRLTDYASKVEVYMGSTLVGSADASDFTKKAASDVACGTEICYVKTLTLDNAIVRAGASKKATFYVKIEAISNLDSADIEAGANDWNVIAGDMRYQDATGVIMTDDQFETNDFAFTDLAGSGDVKLTLSKASTSPVLGNVEVSDTGTTSDVLMLAFKIKAAGSDMSFDTLNVDLTATGATLANMIDQLVLKNGSDELATFDALSTTLTTQSVDFDLGDMFTISKDTTETFNVYARIMEISTASNTAAIFGQGDTLAIAAVADDVVNAEDSNGDLVDVLDMSGAATGAAQAFYSTGAIVTYVSDSYTAPVLGDSSADGTISLKFKVTAFGDNSVTINAAQTEGASPAAGVLVYDLTGGTQTGNAVVSSSDLVADTSVFTVEAGDSATFTLAIKFTPSGGFVKVALTNVDSTAVSNVETASH